MSKIIKARVTLIIISLTLFMLFGTCKKSPTEPTEEQPGRRDYVWTVDTLKADDWFGFSGVWGTSANNIWITAVGVSPKDCLWHYDGLSWKKSAQILDASLNTVFGASDDEIWIGDSYGTFWRNKGNGWEKYQIISLEGYDRMIIANICGTAKNNLYAVGTASNDDGSGYKGIILKYDGKDWKFLDIPYTEVGFERIKRMKDGRFLLMGTNYEKGFLEKLYIYDENKLIEIYSDYNYPGMFELDDNIFVKIKQLIFKVMNNNLVEWRNFQNTTFLGNIVGRTEKDFFVAGIDGILHYNGTDIINLYTNNFLSGGEVIFERDVFFYSIGEKDQNIIIRGTLGKNK